MVQGAAFRPQYLRMRGFEYHSCHIFSTNSHETNIHRNLLRKKWELNQLPSKPRDRKIYQENHQRGRMAEWSEALRLGRSIFGCVCSNPTPVIFFLQFHKRQISTGNAQKKKEVKSITEHTQIKIYQENYQRGRMAEWSKALRLGRSIFGCVGSNTTPVTFFLQIHTRQISTGICSEKSES